MPTKQKDKTMKKTFDEDEHYIELSKYFMLFLDETCTKLGFLLYYHPHQKAFIVSDIDLGENYKYYKTTEQIKIEQPVAKYSSDNFYWEKKSIILFNKEEPYEQNDGEYYYPDCYEFNHDIDFKMSIPNLQKILLSVLKNPTLQENFYHIQDIFSTYNPEIYFPSENLNIDEKLDLLFINNLDQQYLLETMLRNQSDTENIVNILQKKSEQYIIEFFKCFETRSDVKFKDFILKVTKKQDVLEKIFEHFPEYNKFLDKNTPTEFLSQPTQQVSLFKSFFNLDNLSIIYHQDFNKSEVQNRFLHILQNHALKLKMQEKNIIVHSAFHQYTNNSIVSLVENNSDLPIEKIENFFCQAITYLEKDKGGNYNNSGQDNLLKFFQYFYQNEVSLLNSHYKKIKPNKI